MMRYPFSQWVPMVLSQLQGSMHLAVVTTSPPLLSVAPEVMIWYEQNQSLVYMALVSATAGIPILETQVSRCWDSKTPDGVCSSALTAWQIIRDFYVRVTPTTPAWLQQRLTDLRPAAKESMTSYLLRCGEL